MRFSRISLDLPLPPSVNNLHGIGARKRDRSILIDDEGGRTRVRTHTEVRARVYRMPHYRAWINEAGAEVLAQRPRWPVRHLPDGWYCVRCLWPVDAPADTDNPVKALLDFLHTMRLTPDDRFLWAESARRSHLVPTGRCRVTAWSFDPRRP